MSDATFQSLSRAELLQELAKLGRALESEELDAVVDMGIVPIGPDSSRPFPMFALVQLVDCAAIRGSGDLDELRRREVVFSSALEGTPEGLTGAHRELRQALATRAVLGELHRMLPVLEGGALETLRGDARLEWRVRSSLAEIARMLATDRYRDHAMTPILARPGVEDTLSRARSVRAQIEKLIDASEAPPQLDAAAEPGAATADEAEGRRAAAPRRPARTMRTGAPMVQPERAGEDEPVPARSAIAPPPEPYLPGPDDVHAPGYLRARSAPEPPGAPENSGFADFGHGASMRPPTPPELGRVEFPISRASRGGAAAGTGAVSEPAQAAPLASPQTAQAPGRDGDAAQGRVPRDAAAAPPRSAGELERSADPAAADQSQPLDADVRGGRMPILSRPHGAVALTSALGARGDDEVTESFVGGAGATVWDDPSGRTTGADRQVPLPDWLADPEALGFDSPDAGAAELAAPRAEPARHATAAPAASVVELPSPSSAISAAPAAPAAAGRSSTMGLGLQPQTPQRATHPSEPAARPVSAPWPELPDVEPELTETSTAFLSGTKLPAGGPLGGTRRLSAPSSDARRTVSVDAATTRAENADVAAAAFDPFERSATPASQPVAELPLRKPATAAPPTQQDTHMGAPAAEPASAGRRQPAPNVGEPTEETRDVPSVPPSAQVGPDPVTMRRSTPAAVRDAQPPRGDQTLLATPEAPPPVRAPAESGGATVSRRRLPAPPLVDASDLGAPEDARTRNLTNTNSVVQLPVRRRSSETDHVDIEALGRAPREALDRLAARLEEDSGDVAAQEELITMLGSSDRILAREVWRLVREPLASDPSRAEAYFGALVVMAERDPETARKVEWRLAAAQVAEANLDEPRHAFELLLDVLRDDPRNATAARDVARLAGEHGWWSALIATLEVTARSREGSIETVVGLVRLAGDLARDRLRDPGKALELYQIPLDRGHYDEDLVAQAIDLHTQRGSHADLLLLLLRAAQLAGSEAKMTRLIRAADLCVEEIGDPERALAIYEAAMPRDPTVEVRRRYIALAGECGAIDRALDHLTAHVTPAENRAVERARLARAEFGDTAAELSALRIAFESAGADRLGAGFLLADALRRQGQSDEEVGVLEKMLASAKSSEEYASVVRRLGGAMAARPGGAADAIELYSEAMRSKRYDEKIVHALASLLRAEQRVDELIAVYGRAAAQTTSPELRRGYYRSVARVAAEMVEDDDAALELLERAVDASDHDPEVLFRLAERCRRVGDVLSEMGALQQAVDTTDAAVAPQVLARLAELEMARPRGAQSAAGHLERVLALDRLSPEVEQAVGRILPRVANDAGRPDLSLTWLRRLLSRAQTPTDRLVLLRSILPLEEEVGVEPAERVRSAEAALAAAEDAGLVEVERAPLLIAVARAKMAVGHWNSAIEFAASALRALLVADPACAEALAAQRTLAELTAVAVEPNAAFAAMADAAATDVPALCVVYADACVQAERWDEAERVIELTLPGLDDAAAIERLSVALADIRARDFG
ncbi:MAG: hypothetical protein H6698_04795 [Myxococcales bacterium]|nr:hypothetical protein [Myxococcales bacterium]